MWTALICEGTNSAMAMHGEHCGVTKRAPHFGRFVRGWPLDEAEKEERQFIGGLGRTFISYSNQATAATNVGLLFEERNG